LALCKVSRISILELLKQNKVEISLIVATFNRGSLLKGTLKSILDQTLDAETYEIIIVDNGSTDNTKGIVNSVILEYPVHRIRYIFEPEPGLLAGRHRGATEAIGDILIFIDDDIEAHEGWLQAIKITFDNPVVQIVGGRNLPRFEVPPPSWISKFKYPHRFGWVLGDLSVSDFGEKMRFLNANEVWGLNFSIRKSALFELGGFHPDKVPKHLLHLRGDGETGLTEKANERGYLAVYQPKALIYHHITQDRMTFESFRMKRYEQGISQSFNVIRKQYDINKFKKNITKRLQPRIAAKLLALRWLIKDFFRPVKEPIIFEQTKAREILTAEEEKNIEQIRQAFDDGYSYHQKIVKQNPELLKWVLKDDYWDYKLPEIRLK